MSRKPRDPVERSYQRRPAGRPSRISSHDERRVGGPVTEGKADVTLENDPSSRRLASAGEIAPRGWRERAHRVSAIGNDQYDLRTITGGFCRRTHLYFRWRAPPAFVSVGGRSEKLRRCWVFFRRFEYRSPPVRDSGQYLKEKKRYAQSKIGEGRHSARSTRAPHRLREEASSAGMASPSAGAEGLKQRTEEGPPQDGRTPPSQQLGTKIGATRSSTIPSGTSPLSPKMKSFSSSPDRASTSPGQTRGG